MLSQSLAVDRFLVQDFLVLLWSSFSQIRCSDSNLSSLDFSATSASWNRL